jgi:matrixin/carboxypeptidase family protein
MQMSVGRSLALALLALAATPAMAAVRLTYQLNGAAVPVAWSSAAFPIRYAIDRRVATAFPLGTAIIDRAFGEWTAVADANITFQSSGIVDGARAGKDGQNSVTFADDLFKDQNFLAMTTNWYDDAGHMIEADIQIDPSVPGAGYNLQLLVEHEVGHLLGLDHSAVLSSVMYPFVGRGGLTALDSDDRVAIASLYPRGDPAAVGATLTGRVTGDNGGIFAAQVVALNENGEPVATALSDQQGQFVIEGVPAGTYRLYAEPLDGPVEVRNLSGIYRTAKVWSFPTEFANGGPLRVEPGKLYGNLLVNSVGSIKLNPKWIGSSAPTSSDLSLSAAPVMVPSGQTLSIAVGGDGFVGGMTTFDIPNPGFRRTSNFSYGGNYVSAVFNVAPNAPPGSVTVLVKSGNESAALTGALRVTSHPRTRVAYK